MEYLKKYQLIRLIDNIASKVKSHSKLFVIIVTILFSLLTSFTGLIGAILIFVPFVAAIVLALGYDKLVAITSTVVSMLVGFIGGVYVTFRDPNNYYGYGATTIEKLSTLDLYSNIWAKLVLLVLGTALLVFFITRYIKNLQDKKVKYELNESNEVLVSEVKGDYKNIKTWPMIVIFTIILSSTRITYLIVKKEKFVLYKELSYLLFVIYLLSLFYIVTFQDDNYGTSNLVPFKEMFRYKITSRLFVKNIIGNILLYMPFGFFITAYINERKIFPTVLLTFISSLSIELVQLLIGRVFDIDDIMLNLLGGILGACIYVWLDRLRDKLPNALNKEWFMNLIMILLLLFAVIYFTNLSAYFYNMVK